MPRILFEAHLIEHHNIEKIMLCLTSQSHIDNQMHHEDKTILVYSA